MLYWPSDGEAPLMVPAPAFEEASYVAGLAYVQETLLDDAGDAPHRRCVVVKSRAVCLAVKL
jgi:hypothetical protein